MNNFKKVGGSSPKTPPVLLKKRILQTIRKNDNDKPASDSNHCAGFIL